MNTRIKAVKMPDSNCWRFIEIDGWGTQYEIGIANRSTSEDGEPVLVGRYEYKPIMINLANSNEEKSIKTWFKENYPGEKLEISEFGDLLTEL